MNTNAFVVTNPTDESNSSRLAVSSGVVHVSVATCCGDLRHRKTLALDIKERVWAGANVPQSGIGARSAISSEMEQAA